MKNDQNKTWKVYTHTAPNGDVYVGVTGQDLTLRWRQASYKTTSLKPYIEQFGWENITHQVIYTCEDKEEAYKVEEEMRQYYTEKGCCINMRQSGLIKANDMNAYDRQYYQNHKEEKAAYDRQYYEQHKEERNAYKRQWREANPDYMRQWFQDHKEERTAYQRQYRAKKKAEKLLQSGQIEMPLAS